MEESNEKQRVSFEDGREGLLSRDPSPAREGARRIPGSQWPAGANQGTCTTAIIQQLLVPWNPVVSAEWTASEHVNISEYSRGECLVSDEKEDRWRKMVQPGGYQRAAPSCADRTGSTKAVRWEHDNAQGAEKAAACQDGRERGTRDGRSSDHMLSFRSGEGCRVCSQQDESHGGL